MPDTTRKRLFGLVGPGGAGASSVGQSNEWKLNFRLTAWREPGGEVVAQERICSLPVSRSETQEWIRRVQAYDVIEVEIEVEGSKDRPATILRGLLQTGVQDAQLRQIAASLQTPIVLSDPTFGELVYERAYNWYTGKAAWNGKTIDISLSCPDPQNTQTVMDTARHLFDDQASWQKRVNDYAVERLLELKNDCWLGDSEIEVSAEEFISKMTLESITIEADASFTFWHDDGDLFFGHAIQISGDLVNGMTDADIPG